MPRQELDFNMGHFSCSIRSAMTGLQARVPVVPSAKGRGLAQACQKMTIPTVRRRNSEWTRRSANPVSPAERTVKKRRAGIPKL